MDLKKLGAIGGAISLALCWPLAVGQIGQTVIQDGVAHLSNDSLQAEIVEYDRGYLSSTVKTRYTIVDPVLAEQLAIDGLPSEVIVSSSVSHGLFSLSAESVMENAPDLPLTLNTVTQLNGNTDYVLSLANWNQVTEGPDGVIVSVTPSTLKGHVSVLGDVSYDLDIPSVEIDFNSGEKMLLSGLTGQGQGKKMNSFWIGEQTFNLAEASVLNVDQSPLFSLSDSKYTFLSSFDEMAKTVSSQHIVDMNKLVMEDGNVDSVSIDLSFGDLDSVAFEHLMNLYQNNPMPTNADIEEAIPYVESLFSKGFYFAMNKMAVKLGEESEFESKWKITVPQGTDNVTQNPAMILPALTGDLDTFFSSGLVTQYPFIKQGVDEAMAMELVQETDKGYQIQAELKEGNLVFGNGQQIPLMALLLPALMQP
ncbi:DUF945 family protein [Vibrio europaeus]|uniref:DUF945 family protein n=1 Tax=Vibrio europaeus TaxID=300876 RepID=A0AAE7DWL9_9VIBR|nr:DUF945 family protein [Vibrio europaeus]MDC5807092.1 DUF945 family protein [Vibrio europaeus]MDC5809687.1 DUF945 family protein [Vibrio europaeus]MDC5827617.1 DUF945 family protein [Vibrio europaeus]MDC5830461.1 DUF945 family protein [Vibrio europaeus]MDC5837317.1 DUF945 family protein [Vibrio europaeus]